MGGSMFRRLFIFSYLFAASSVFSRPFLPEFIEAEKFNLVLDQYTTSTPPQAWTEGSSSFNQAPELIPFFVFLQQEYGIQAVVETGTFRGETTALFAVLFNEVHTIEIAETQYHVSKNALSRFSNVCCHFGSSSEVLSQITPNLAGKPTVFYLDAHWNEYWPLLDEITEIGKVFKDNCIIVIDDIKVPGRKSFPYDRYADIECSYKYVEKHLGKVFTDYTVHYLLPKRVDSRAKLVIIPKVFKK